jgi:hypothetical protein
VVADFTGRGATKSRAFPHQDMVVRLVETGATKAEVNLVAARNSELVWCTVSLGSAVIDSRKRRATPL